jgi:flagellar basal-body rod protein FlgC
MRLSSLGISASALAAERKRLDVVAENIANAQTTRGADGKAYHRKEVVFESVAADAVERGGVRVADVVESSTPMAMVYNPGHPDANPQGYVEMPNVNVVEEMVDLLAATRAYEANVAAANATKTLASRALDIGRR